MEKNEALEILNADTLFKIQKDTSLSIRIAIETLIREVSNSIQRKKIEDKIEELNEGIKEDMKNYDKVKDESWKFAIHRSMRQKIEVKKFLQELLEDK